MKILTVLFFHFLILCEAKSALEGTRDWAAFSDLNSKVNTWLREDTDEEVKARYINLLFFQFWLMYYGPDKYKDDEAAAVRTYFEIKFKGTKKKLNFTRADFAAILGMKDIPDNELASKHCAPSMGSLRIKDPELTLGKLRSIISDFEKWSSENM